MKKIIIILAVILTSAVTAWAVTNNSDKPVNQKVTVEKAANSTNNIVASGNLATAD